jgi:uncharacterized membrane protein YfcA
MSLSDCCGVLLNDRFLPWAAAATMLAGLVRGATGFGQALVFVPLAGLLYEPKIAVPLLWVTDALVTPLLLRPHLRRADWSEIIPLVIGGTVMLPLGIWLLNHVDPILLRWAISSLVLLSTVAVAAGWRFRLAATYPVSLAVGGLSGLTGGATGIKGAPLVVFWLGRNNDAGQIRSNIFIYLWLTVLVSLAVGAAQGLLSSRILLEGLVLAPCYGIAMVAGNWVFHRSQDLSPIRREMIFRRLALGLCAASACAGLPIWR